MHSKGKILKVGTLEWIHGADWSHGAAKLSGWEFNCMGNVPAVNVIGSGPTAFTDSYTILPTQSEMAGWTMRELDVIANGQAIED